MMLESEHLVDTAVDALDRSTQIVGILSFAGGSGDWCKNTTVQFEGDSYHTTKVADTDR